MVATRSSVIVVLILLIPTGLYAQTWTDPEQRLLLHAINDVHAKLEQLLTALPTLASEPDLKECRAVLEEASDKLNTGETADFIDLRQRLKKAQLILEKRVQAIQESNAIPSTPQPKGGDIRASGEAVARKTASVLIVNATDRRLTVRCRFWIDDRGVKVRDNGSWEIGPQTSTFLSIDGKVLTANRFGYTIISDDKTSGDCWTEYKSGKSLTIHITEAVLSTLRGWFFTPSPAHEPLLRMSKEELIAFLQRNAKSQNEFYSAHLEFEGDLLVSKERWNDGLMEFTCKLSDLDPDKIRAAGYSDSLEALALNARRNPITVRNGRIGRTQNNDHTKIHCLDNDTALRVAAALYRLIILSGGTSQGSSNKVTHLPPLGYLIQTGASAHDDAESLLEWAAFRPCDDSYPHVVAGEKEGIWIAEKGYSWLTGIEGDLRVQWIPGKAFGNLITANEGIWKPAPGYAWVSPEAGNFDVRPVERSSAEMQSNENADSSGALTVGTRVRNRSWGLKWVGRVVETNESGSCRVRIDYAAPRTNYLKGHSYDFLQGEIEAYNGISGAELLDKLPK